MTTIFIHPTTKHHLDYGDHVSTETGVMYSFNGHPPGWYEAGVSAQQVLERFGDIPPSMSVTIGEHLVRRFDMNPRGLI